MDDFRFDDFRFVLDNRLHEIEHKLRSVLTVGMDNGEYARAEIEPSLETCLLGPAVALIDFMVNDIQPRPSTLELLRHLASVVGTFVIDNDGDPIVPEKRRYARKHGRQRLLGAVGRNHDGLLHRGRHIKSRPLAPDR